MTKSCIRRLSAASAVIVAGAVLASCQGSFDALLPKEKKPVPEYLVKKMKVKGMRTDAPIMLRIFKKSSELEVWKKTHTGRYALLQNYEICKWSGRLGPKLKEGDKQAPEGFYTVNKHQMNPNSKYHLSFNMGFPNTYDRSHDRTGSHLMIHGACSSAGCYSMTDEKVEEIFALARDSFGGGQKAFQIQAYPFRMTAENMVAHRDHQYFDFWKMLKRGHDHFEITRVPPKVDVCEKRYVFNTLTGSKYAARAQCPAMSMPVKLARAFTKQQTGYAETFERLLAKSERRKPLALAPLTIETALPGILVEQAKPQPPVVQTRPADVTGSTGESPTPEATLRPAG